MSTIIVILVFSVLVIVHEWGHFITARKLGVRVERFSIGFGKKLFSWFHQGTEFMFCLIPMGGYVKLAGDERSQCKGTQDEFYSHPVGHRVLIVFMGPVVNFVFAFFCFYYLFLTGFPATSARVGRVLENYPAAMAGIQENDLIEQINNAPIKSWDDVEKNVRASSGQVLNVKLLRGQQELLTLIKPQETVLKNIFSQEERVWVIGIQAKPGDFVYLKYSLVEALPKAFHQLTQICGVTLKALYRIITGAMPVQGNMGGPILIFVIIKSAATMGLAHLVFIVGVISASLGLINLFPFPVLDGGHIFFMTIEKLRSKPLSLKVEENFTKFGFSVLICLMVFLLYNDMAQMGWLDTMRKIFIGLMPK